MSGKGRRTIRESDLYQPICDYLTHHGYTVRGEVKSCDVAAVKDDELIVIEMKQAMTLALILQASQRQRFADAVYVAVLKPVGGIHTRKWNHIKHLLKRLELGLILVSFRRKNPCIEIAFHPLPFDPPRSRKRRSVILKEIAGRSANYNIGGVRRQKIITAYRETAILIACCLRHFGELSPRHLRHLETGPKTLSVLSNNVYGWFVRVRHGIYALTGKGEAAIAVYGDIAGPILEDLRNTPHPATGALHDPGRAGDIPCDS